MPSLLINVIVPFSGLMLKLFEHRESLLECDRPFSDCILLCKCSFNVGVCYLAKFSTILVSGTDCGDYCANLSILHDAGLVDVLAELWTMIVSVVDQNGAGDVDIESILSTIIGDDYLVEFSSINFFCICKTCTYDSGKIMSHLIVQLLDVIDHQCECC